MPPSAPDTLPTTHMPSKSRASILVLAPNAVNTLVPAPGVEGVLPAAPNGAFFNGSLTFFRSTQGTCKPPDIPAPSPRPDSTAVSVMVPVSSVRWNGTFSRPALIDGPSANGSKLPEMPLVDPIPQSLSWNAAERETFGHLNSQIIPPRHAALSWPASIVTRNGAAGFRP